MVNKVKILCIAMDSTSMNGGVDEVIVPMNKETASNVVAAVKTIDDNNNTAGNINEERFIDPDDMTNSSFLEFLNQEQQCLDNDNDSEVDIDSIFEEINRLSGDSNERGVDEILREAELLLSKQEDLSQRPDNGYLTNAESLKTISEESTTGRSNDDDNVDESREIKVC